METTNIQDKLEELIDCHSLFEVLGELEQVCIDRANVDECYWIAESGLHFILKDIWEHEDER